MPGRVQDRFEIKEGEIKSREHLMLCQTLQPPAAAADLMAGHLIPRAPCQSFVTSAAPYQTFRKRDPRKQIINNEIRRWYRKRNRALLRCRTAVWPAACQWAMVPRKARPVQIRPQGRREKWAGTWGDGAASQAPPHPAPAAAPGEPLPALSFSGVLLGNLCWLQFQMLEQVGGVPQCGRAVGSSGEQLTPSPGWAQEALVLLHVRARPRIPGP